ncbi:undecaprenyl-diphosphatase [Desulfitispora alkaliphila]|uniref:phosphatase PAP2 family protein n=1 Tax=Desulfitispora alkaliphila TaxID=622674 RepID=UPI003D242AAF
MLATIDEKLFHIFFNTTMDNALLANLSIFATNMSSKLFAIIYITIIGILIWNRSKKLIPFIIAPATAVVIVQLFRFLYERPRPFVALEIESLIYHAPNASLPSMHAVSAFVIAMAIYYVYKKLGVIMLLLATMTALSRVMVGVHYPLDILAGALLGIALSACVFNFSNYFEIRAGFLKAR